MLRRILVPLDGSKLSERALASATQLAAATDASLVLVRAVVERSMPGRGGQQRLVDAMHETDRYLEAFADPLRARGFVCETATCYGQPAACVLEAARTHQADLIVMASHARVGAGRWLFGSVAEAIVARSPVPVLVQRSSQSLSGKVFTGEDLQIMVPLDGTAFAEAALEPAAGLAEDLQAHLVLVRVEDDPRSIADALQYLPRVQERVAAQHPRLVVDSDIRVGEPALGIEEAVAERGKALVVLATHGRTGLSRSLLGSTAGKVLLTSDVPVVFTSHAQSDVRRSREGSS
jgi:nucleotide-binding universal stress UspA family protein